MATFLYHCPTTGMKVQGFVAEDPNKRDDNSYRPVTCAVCARTHLVNPKTGKVIGD